MNRSPINKLSKVQEGGQGEEDVGGGGEGEESDKERSQLELSLRTKKSLQRGGHILDLQAT